ncbi:MAG: GNAT family N-acetyltransferase [Candidatus Baltobacteraceae bacterium]
MRPYRNGDERDLVHVFHRSVREVAIARYSDLQVRAWSSSVPDPKEWRKRMRQRETFVADNGSTLVGWIELVKNGHLDMLYCAPEAAGTGVAGRLYDEIIRRAHELILMRLFTEASLFAESFFRKRGWKVDEREIVIRAGVEIPRARMSTINF